MLWVNVADTPHKLAQGLMFVKEMSDDTGMLFKFQRPQKLSFWGQNTYIPLDIAFVNSDGVIVDIKEIEPHSLKAVASDKECCMAIEANIDYFSKNNIRIGDKVEIKEDPYDGTFVSFSTIKTAGISETRPITVEDAQNLPYDEDQVSLQQEPEDEYSLEQQQEEAWDFLQQQEQTLGEENDPYAESPIDPNKIYTPSDLMSVEDEDEEEEFRYQRLTEHGFVDIDEDEQKPEAPEGEYPQFSDPMDLMVWADEQNQVVWIDYDTKSGVNIKRIVEPHGIYISEKGNINVATFDETVNDIRAFIIKRINDFQILGRTFNDKFMFSPN